MNRSFLLKKYKYRTFFASCALVAFAGLHLCFYSASHPSFPNTLSANKIKNIDTGMHNRIVINNAANLTQAVSETSLIARVWHGWTTKANAASFEKLLTKDVFPSFDKQNIKGYRGAQLLKRELESEVEFTTIMWFESVEAIKAFAGEDYETAHIDPKVRSLFIRFDAKSTHSVLQYSSLQ